MAKKNPNLTRNMTRKLNESRDYSISGEERRRKREQNKRLLQRNFDLPKELVAAILREKERQERRARQKEDEPLEDEEIASFNHRMKRQ